MYSVDKPEMSSVYLMSRFILYVCSLLKFIGNTSFFFFFKGKPYMNIPYFLYPESRCYYYPFFLQSHKFSHSCSVELVSCTAYIIPLLSTVFSLLKTKNYTFLKKNEWVPLKRQSGIGFFSLLGQLMKISENSWLSHVFINLKILQFIYLIHKR